MLKMVFLALLLLGLIFNMVTIEVSLSINAYSQIPFIPAPPPLSSPNQEQHQQSSAAALTSSLEGKNNQGTILNDLNNNTSKVVILTFGDGYQSQYIYAKPVLDKYGFKANFFVTCNRIGTTNSEMTWQEIVQLYNEGHVIGSKTMNYGTKAIQHRDLNDLSAKDLEFEVGQSKQCLLDHGIKTSIFAVPKNVAANNATVINTIAKYYGLAINGHSNLTYLHCNGYKHNSTQTDCRTYFDNGNFDFCK